MRAMLALPIVACFLFSSASAQEKLDLDALIEKQLERLEQSIEGIEEEIELVDEGEKVERANLERELEYHERLATLAESIVENEDEAVKIRFLQSEAAYEIMDLNFILQEEGEEATEEEVAQWEKELQHYKELLKQLDMLDNDKKEKDDASQ